MFDVATLISRPRKVGFWLFIAFMSLYVIAASIVFFLWINPSLNGGTDQHIAADSSTYIYMAEVLREGRNDPLVLAALASFPNTLWMPVFIALVLKSTLLMAVVDFLIFWWSLYLFKRSSSINIGVFTILLLLNPTTTVSLLSVNKEIIDLLVVALFVYYVAKGQRWPLWPALAISFISRYEVCAALILFIVLRSRLNPLRQRRWLTLLLVLCVISILLPLLASKALNERFVEASEGGVIAFLDSLEMHYLFIIAVAPKVVETFFGEILNPSKIAKYDLQDLANSYILLGNNIANVIVLIYLKWKHMLTIKADWIYLSLVSGTVMAISLVVQPRYFYICYALFCFQAAHISYVPQRDKVSGYMLAREGHATI